MSEFGTPKTQPEEGISKERELTMPIDEDSEDTVESMKKKINIAEEKDNNRQSGERKICYPEEIDKDLREKIREIISGLNQKNVQNSKDVDCVIQEILLEVENSRQSSEEYYQELERSKGLFEGTIPLPGVDINKKVEGLYELTNKIASLPFDKMIISDIVSKMKSVREEIENYSEVKEIIQTNQFSESIELLEKIEGMLLKETKLQIIANELIKKLKSLSGKE